MSVFGGPRFVVAAEPAGVPTLAFNPLAPNLGGRKKKPGDTPDPGSVPLHLFGPNPDHPTLAKGGLKGDFGD